VPEVSLVIAGYETQGHPEYVRELLSRAEALGLEDRVSYRGLVPLRRDLLAECRLSDVGLALMPMDSADFNERSMAGASNKPFDYLAGGLPLLVSDLPDWTDMFVGPGMARPCDPRTADGIARALRWYVEHPVELRAMGERGRCRVADEWNYEVEFAPVADALLDLVSESRDMPSPALAP
jgi:glycosyltransferase involved in cell wall biosynthesis